jgi:hypothetical protein
MEGNLRERERAWIHDLYDVKTLFFRFSPFFFAQFPRLAVMRLGPLRFYGSRKPLFCVCFVTIYSIRIRVHKVTLNMMGGGGKQSIRSSSPNSLKFASCHCFSLDSGSVHRPHPINREDPCSTVSLGKPQALPSPLSSPRRIRNTSESGLPGGVGCKERGKVISGNMAHSSGSGSSRVTPGDRLYDAPKPLSVPLFG